MIKRAVDIILSGTGLMLLLPFLMLVGCLIKIDSSGPMLFRQERIGRHFRPFQINKFRTMTASSSSDIGLTVGHDVRITRLGRWLRKTKVDELPQLYNVLVGEMSLVGPRPELSHYVEKFRKDYEELLTIRPGMTDLASLKYRHEADLLGSDGDPEQLYETYILPDKIRLGKVYLDQSSFLVDCAIMAKTLLCIR